jgi:hypothetical protein
MRGSKIYTSTSGRSHYFYVDFPPGPGGERNQRKITVPGSYKDCEKKQREILTQIDRGQFSAVPTKMTLGEFLDYYLGIVQGKRANTYRSYVLSFKAFRRQLG